MPGKIINAIRFQVYLFYQSDYYFGSACCFFLCKDNVCNYFGSNILALDDISL